MNRTSQRRQKVPQQGGAGALPTGIRRAKKQPRLTGSLVWEPESQENQTLEVCRNPVVQGRMREATGRSEGDRRYGRRDLSQHRWRKCHRAERERFNGPGCADTGPGMISGGSSPGRTGAPERSGQRAPPEREAVLV